MKQWIQREPIGYRYWVSVLSRNGWRQVGPDVLCVMDDFGNLVTR